MRDYIQQRAFVDNKLSLDELANNYALEHVMTKYEANHGLTFHSRVKLAKKFATRHQELFPSTKSFSVNGEQPTSERNRILEVFKNSQKAIVSNARCLTEGVDIPTIDLVYFCDPKNSKVDIVQAVGRALRKKEEKKLGLIVVPIYHLNEDEVEVERSISESSFKNLLQVIRALCDQDERLQDEINSIAFGKGKRKSSRIDIGFSKFTDEQDIIILQGFEEKLKTSLFDQIIYKSSNNWDLWFLELIEYLENNNNSYPSREENQGLYNWIATQRNRKNRGQLKNEEIRKLDSINFVWDKVEQNWEIKYEELVNFRKENPNKWPQYDRENTKSKESLLSVFCQSIRQRYREGDLENHWLDKMFAIGFNFEGKTDNWSVRWQSIKELLESKNSISVDEIGQNAYSWILRNKKKYDNGELTKDEEKKIEELNLDRFFETWEQKFDRIKVWVEKNGRLPTPKTEKGFNSWLASQRAVYKNNRLTDKQIESLQSIGYDLDAQGKERQKERWNERFEELKSFKLNNNNWPKPSAEGLEKELYNWCQAQRQAQAGTHSGGKRKPLHQWQVDKLDSIEFIWNSRADEKTWEEWFQELSNYVSENGNVNIPTNINGKRNPLYAWWALQKSNYKNKTEDFPAEYLQKLKDIGIDLASGLQTVK